MRKDILKERKRLERLYFFEEQFYRQGYRYLAGVDEAGRGPLAGPVVACAVILPPYFYLPRLNDSKLLPTSERELLYKIIKKEAIDISIGIVSNHIIDEYNILQATIEAMKKAVKKLDIRPDYLLIDALKIKDIHVPQKSIIHGDRLSASIAAASIVAKVERDKLMCQLHEKYPHYGFNQHKGYCTRIHLKALAKHGPCPVHRLSFSPVKKSRLASAQAQRDHHAS